MICINSCSYRLLQMTSDFTFFLILHQCILAGTQMFHRDKSIISVSLCYCHSFLVTIMGLVIPWSLTLAILDGYSILTKFPVGQSGILRIIILGDMVLSILTLAAASSTASIVDLLLKADVSFCPPRFCSRYLISAAMAFFSWFLLLSSSLSNLWLLPSLDVD
ncbi:hypothetical protein ACS0TY_001815 [Phlomoides rotata]